MKVKRWDVVYFENELPKEKRIQGGKRPYIVVSNDKGNNSSPVCVCVPLSSKIKRLDMSTHAVTTLGTALCEQLFTFSQDNVSSIVCRLFSREMQMVNHCLKVSLGVEE